MYIIVEDGSAIQVDDLFEFYVDNFSNSTRENLISDIKHLNENKSIMDILKSYNLEVYEVKRRF